MVRSVFGSTAVVSGLILIASCAGGSSRGAGTSAPRESSDAAAAEDSGISAALPSAEPAVAASAVPVAPAKPARAPTPDLACSTDDDCTFSQDHREMRRASDCECRGCEFVALNVKTSKLRDKQYTALCSRRKPPCAPKNCAPPGTPACIEGACAFR